MPPDPIRMRDVAAPIAAWLVKKLAARVLGVAAGGLIIVTNSKTIAEALGADSTTVVAVAATLAVVWVTGIVVAVRQERLASGDVSDRGLEVAGQRA